MCTSTHFSIDIYVYVCYNIIIAYRTAIGRGKNMRMERIAVTMPHSTAKAFRRLAQIHDTDLCVIAKMAVTDYCLKIPSQQELMDKEDERQDRIFISMPDTAMRCLQLWSANTGIPRTKLMEWAIRKLAEEQSKEEEQKK